ncbi:LLM class F420-dependent oxidoreductase [Amycolatopsis endophytica]
MQFGLFGVNLFTGAGAAGARHIAVLAEELGLESLWAVDRIVLPSGYETGYPYDESGKVMGGQEEFDVADPLVWLTFAAAVTVRIKLATGVAIPPLRNPVVLAKQVASLDALSAGRVLLGVGIGWLEEEYQAVGVPWSDRGRRLDDYVEALRALWRDTRATVHNGHVDFDNAISLPHPTGGSVPVVVSGNTPRAARRAARLGDGFFPAAKTPAELAPLLEILRTESQAAGGDPDAIEITVSYAGEPAALDPAADGFQNAFDDLSELSERFEKLGVARVLLPALPEHALRAVAEGLADRFGPA